MKVPTPGSQMLLQMLSDTGGSVVVPYLQSTRGTGQRHVSARCSGADGAPEATSLHSCSHGGSEEADQPVGEARGAQDADGGGAVQILGALAGGL